jgi:arginine decarboxylase
MMFVPKRVFFTKGVGNHKSELRSFELALREAGIERCNLVKVSSILPPHCKIVSKTEGIKEIQSGAITYVVMAKESANEPHRLVGASVGLAVPTENSDYGYLSERHGFGMTEKVLGDEAEDIAAAMLASTLGLDFDEEKSWDENKDVYNLNNKIVKATNVTKTAVVPNDGRHTTVIAVAVFLF